MPLRKGGAIHNYKTRTISTDNPFVHPQLFQSYDPERLLGIEATVVLTHLASGRVVRAVAERLGYRLDREETTTALHWAKSRAYRQNEAVVPDEEFAGFLDGRGIRRDSSRASD